MSALPLWVKAAFAAGLIAAVWRAYFGPPPVRRDARRAVVWVGVGLGLHVFAFAAMVADAWFAAPALAAGVGCWCVAAWNFRGEEGDEGGGGGGPDDPGPIDWDSFDRARAGWSRGPHVPA